MIRGKLHRFALGTLLLAAVLSWSGCNCETPILVDFEDPALGAEYFVGDTIVDSGVTMTGGRFYYHSGGFTDGGKATIQNLGEAGGTGKELWTNNINISFDFGGTCRDLTLAYGDYDGIAGNTNIYINGTLSNVLRLTELDGTTVNGVTITVSESGGVGVLTLTGTITSFAIGGQEFCIDDVSTTRI